MTSISNNDRKCPKCLKIFSSNKYLTKHLTICKKKEPEIQEINHPSLENNEEEDDKEYKTEIEMFRTIEIRFDTSHLNKDMFDKLVTRETHNGFDFYCKKIFENKNNRDYIKTSLFHKFSQHKFGINNTSDKLYNKFIYNIYITCLANSLLHFLNQYRNPVNMEEQIQKYNDYIKTMLTHGCFTPNKEYWRKIYKKNLNMMKDLIILYYVIS